MEMRAPCDAVGQFLRQDRVRRPLEDRNRKGNSASRKHPKDAKVWICAMHAYDDDEDNVHEKDITKYHVDEFPSGKDEVGVPQGSDDAGSDESDLFEESEGDEPPPKKHKKVQGPPG